VRRARNIAGIVAVLFLSSWLETTVKELYIEATNNFEILFIRSGIRIEGTTRELDLSQTPIINSLPSNGPWWTTPSMETFEFVSRTGRTKVAYVLDIPHWLANLVAWPVFIVLWRKCRKPPKGHCRKCGYDLTGNESGNCSECGEVVQ